jgi:hypothetical protein
MVNYIMKTQELCVNLHKDLSYGTTYLVEKFGTTLDHFRGDLSSTFNYRVMSYGVTPQVFN